MSVRNIPEGVQARLNTSYTVKYPEFPTFKLMPIQAVLLQEERSHDILVLKYAFSGNWYNKALKTGTPVEFTWQNSSKAKGSFYGHVVNVRRTKAPQNDQELEVRCVAASFPLKNTATNMWTNVTVPEVVKDIAKKTKMKAVVTPHSMRHTQISQFGTSYWQFLQELAYKIGYGCYVRGNTIYFKDLDTIIEKNMGAIPLLSYSQEFLDEFMPPFHRPLEKTLDKFEPIIGDFIEDDDQPTRATKHITGVDPISGKSYNSTGNPKNARNTRSKPAQVVFEDNTSFDVANSKMAADSLTKGKAARTRFHIPARFVSQGDPRIQPYGVVEVRGVDTTVDGYWMVRKVMHTITRRGHYVSEGIVASDGREENVSTKTRSKSGTSVPTLNLRNFGDNDSLALPDAPVLDRNVYMYNEQNSGYELTPRRWRN